MNSLKLENVSVSLPNQSRTIIQDIELTLSPGELVAIVGSNGCGKSSLLKAIRQIYPYKGHMRLGNNALVDLSRQTFAQNIVCITQDVRENLCLNMTVRENIALWQLDKKRLTEEALRHYLMPFNPRLSEFLELPVRHLSGGEMQALCLALVLMNQPRVVLLDEHTSALDPKTAAKIMLLTYQALKENQLSAVMVTHQLDDAIHYADRIVVMQHGCITKEFRSSAIPDKQELLEACYG